MQSPITIDPLPIPPKAVAGQIVVFAAFALIAWALLREAAKVIIKVLLFLGIALAAALWLGLLTSVSPCPLAANIAALSYVGREVGSGRRTLAAGLLYTSVGPAHSARDTEA